MLGLTAPAHADMTHKISSSVQLNVQSAATQATRIGSTYTVSGSGVATTDGTTANTISAGTITSGVMSPGNIAATQVTSGNAFSYSATYTQADAVPTSAPSVGAVGNFGSMTSNAAVLLVIWQVLLELLAYDFDRWWGRYNCYYSICNRTRGQIRRYILCLGYKKQSVLD